MIKHLSKIFFVTMLLLLLSACSIQRIATNQIANSLASSGTNFAADEDPELIALAMPFTLKLIESILAENPDHARLRTAAAAAFTQYAYGFIQLEADYVEAEDFEKASAMRVRARKLFIRAREHGFKRIEKSFPDFRVKIKMNPKDAVSFLEKDLTETIYWTAAAWASAILLGKDDPHLVAELPQMEAMMDRARTLNSEWGEGAIHSFLITYTMSRQSENPIEESRMHFEKALRASRGRLLSPYVAFAESVCVQMQDAKEFQSILHKALSIDLNAHPSARLLNTLMRKRALWLLSQMEELFLIDEEKS